MSEIQIIYKDQDLLAIQGNINMHNIVPLRTRGEKLIIEMQRPCSISFADVYAVQTAALSLILCWIRYAKKHNKQIQFIDLPKQLANWLDIIHLSHLANH
jgi:phospholipid transport system transporter-binding protein